MSGFDKFIKNGVFSILSPKVSLGPALTCRLCILILLSYNAVDLSLIAMTSVTASNSPAVKKEGSVGMSEEDQVHHIIHCPSPCTRVS